MSRELLLTLAAWAAVAPAAASGEEDAVEILRRADKAVLGETAAYALEMTVIRPGKPDRVVEMRGWKKGNQLGRVRYTEPPKERGTAYLRKGKSTWLYLPSAEKVVRVGSKQNFGGSDFSNGDVFRLSLVDDYTATLAGEESMEGLRCHRLDLKAKDRSVAYDRVAYWVRSDGTYFPVRADYYTLSGKRLKRLSASEVARLGGRQRPTLLTMESALEAGSRTLLRFLEIRDGVTLDDRLFTPAALEREE
jgi:outer membrane lipoprotein-sorting protein